MANFVSLLVYLLIFSLSIVTLVMKNGSVTLIQRAVYGRGYTGGGTGDSAYADERASCAS